MRSKIDYHLSNVHLQSQENYAVGLYIKFGSLSVLIKIQPDATVCRYLFTAKLLYMFRVSQHPSSGVLKTVTAASGTGAATSLQRGLIGTPETCRVALL